MGGGQAIRHGGGGGGCTSAPRLLQRKVGADVATAEHTHKERENEN